jgi:hypothetical protein
MTPSDPEPLEPPPPLGSWPRLYAIVLALALVVMLLIGVFSRWAY